MDLFILLSCCLVGFFFPGCACCGPEYGCTCTRCATLDGIAQAPCCLRITFAGFANLSPGTACACERCAALNGTFDIPQLSAAACEWRGTICSAGQPYLACGIGRVNATLVLTGSDYILDVEIRNTSNTVYFRFRKNFGTTKPGCTTWSALSVPYSSAPTALTQLGTCDFSSVTCSVTSLTGVDAAAACAAVVTCDPTGAASLCRCHDLVPPQMQVSIPSGHWTASCGTLADCQLAEGTFILDLFTSTLPCEWRYTFPGGGTSCTWTLMRLTIAVATGGVDMSLSIQAGGGGTPGSANWKLHIPFEFDVCGTATPFYIDCNAARTLDFCSVFNGSGGGRPCDWDALPIIGGFCGNAPAGADITVTPIPA